MGFLDASGITRLCTKLKDKFAAISHNHAASDVTSGTFDSARLPTVPIEKGGTGATTASAAWAALGGGSIGKKDSLVASDIPDLSSTYLPLSGGALTGNVVHEDANVYVDDGTIVSGTIPSANQFGKTIYFRDSGNVDLGAINAASYTSGKQGIRFFAKRTVDETLINNELCLTIDGSGNRSVWVSDTAAWRSGLGITPANIGAAASSHTHNYLPLSGGTMSGNIEMQSDTIDRDAAAPSSYQQGRSIILQDKDGERIGLLRADRSTLNGGSIEFNIGAYSENSGTEVPNLLTLKALPDGTNSVKVTDAAAWRSGLEITPANIGAAASSHTHSASDVVSGTFASDRLPTVPVSKGGTNATTVADARNNLYFGAVQLGSTSSGRQSVTATITSNNAAFVLQRGTTKAIMLVDVWTASPAIFGNLPAEVVLVRGAASGSSGAWTIQNNTNQALTIEALGAKFGDVQDNTAAMTENVTRVQMDAAADHTHNYLPISGGTLTGRVTETDDGTYAVQNDRFDTDTAPSATKYLRVLESFDTHNYTIGMIEQSQLKSTGDFGLSLSAARRINGSYQYNQIIVKISEDGSKTYSISDPANFRNAIGAAASNHTHSYLPLSGGQMTGPLSMKDATAMPRATGTGWYPIVMSGFGSGGAIKYMNPADLLTDIGAAASSHDHSGADITSGTINVARLPYTAARGVEISGSTIRTVNGYVSAMDTTKVTKSSGNGTWTISQVNIEITNTGGTAYVLAFFQISISSIVLTTASGAWYTSASDQVLAFPWTLGSVPRVVSMGTNVDRIQDIWIKKIETGKITFRPLCAQSATVTWAGEFVLLSNKS